MPWLNNFIRTGDRIAALFAIELNRDLREDTGWSQWSYFAAAGEWA